MTNSKREYNEFIRANLPYGITYDSARYQYVTFNGKRFVTYLEAKWYIDYLTKFGGGPEDDIRNDLFGTSEEGVWFEANDANTLFTDTAGTTPVTAPGDAVALQLDKSQGLTLGPELVTNGTFDTDTTGWTAVSGGIISAIGGKGVITTLDGDVAGGVFQNITVESGKAYQVSWDVDAYTGTGWQIQLGDGATASAYYSSIQATTGSFSAILTTTTTTLRLTAYTRSNGVGDQTTTFDNLSVRELPGNHRTQATVAARPLYALHPVGGVRNELEYTEDSDFWKNAAYTKNATSDPFGGNKGILAECGSFGRATISDTLSLPEGETYTFSIWVKAGPSGVASFSLYFREQGGDFTIYGLGPATNSSDAWTRYEVSGVKEADGNVVTVYLQNNEGSAADFYVFGPQLEEGSTATNYQRVGSFLDVSEEGKARRGRLWYNGTSHFMETGTITPGTDKAQVFAGVRKLSDAARGMLMEHSASVAANNGAFAVTAPDAASATFAFESKGTTLVSAVDTGFAAPTTNILTAIGDISGDSAILRIDGVQEAISTGDQGTGNYLAYPLYFGARAGTSLFFNGYEDTSIVRFGPNLDADTISKVESYVASKTPEPTL